MLKIFSILLSSFFSIAGSVPSKATIVAKASAICGSEDTYFIENKVPDKNQIGSIKWILDYTLTEANIGNFDFGEDTGRYLEPEKLAQFLKEKHSHKLGALKTQLLDLQKIKVALRKLRDKKIENASSDEEVKSVVKKYWDAKITIQKELERQFNLKSADTGASCE